MSGRGSRTLRGVIAAVAATFFAALSHGLASAEQVSPAAMSFALIVAVCACVALSGRGLSRARTALAVLLSQAAFHAIFAFMPAAPASRGGFARASGAPGAAGAGAHAHHAGGLPASPAVADPLDPAGAGGALAHAHAGDAAMLLGHALAAAFTILALVHGEAALHAALGALAMALGLARRTPSALRRAWEMPRREPTPPRRPRPAPVFDSGVPRRGPPARFRALFPRAA